MPSPHHLGSEIAEKTGGGKVGGRCSEATVLEKRQGKAFEQAMIESLMDDIYEAQAAAESESLLFQNSLIGSDTGGVFIWLEVLKPEFFIVAPEDR